jgi:hypothetical protein
MKTISILGSLLGALLYAVSSTSAFVTPRPSSSLMHRQHQAVSHRDFETQLNARKSELIMKDDS